MRETPLDDLRHTLTHARLCHEAWWFIEGDNPAREGIVKVYNRYKDFFATVHPALFVTFIVKLCSVFDNDPNSISLKLLPGYETHPGFLDLWQRGRTLFRYRSKVIAHRDVKGPETPWGTANDVVFCWAGSSMEIQTTSPILDFGAAQRLSILAAALFEVVDRQLISLIQQHLPPPLKDGRYTLGLRGDMVEWLIRQP